MEHQKRREGNGQSGTAERLVLGEPGSVTRGPCSPAAASCFDSLLSADTPPSIYAMCPYLKPVKAHRPSYRSARTEAHGVSPRPHRALQPRAIPATMSPWPLGLPKSPVWGSQGCLSGCGDTKPQGNSKGRRARGCVLGVTSSPGLWTAVLE